MYTLEVNYPVAPVLQMPQTIQTALLAICAVATLLVLVYGAMQAKKHGSLLPVLFVFAGFATSLLEAPATNLGHAVHAQVGQIMLYDAVGRAIPWHLALVYAVFFGLTYMLIYARFVAGKLTERYIWQVYFSAMALNYVGEIIPVQQGVWGYYAPQALWIWEGTHPLFWTFLNAGCAIFAAALIMHLLPRLQGWKQILVLVVSPVGAFMGHFGPGFLYYVTANSDWGNLMVQISGLVSVACCLLMVKFCAEHMVERQRAAQG